MVVKWDELFCHHTQVVTTFINIGGKVFEATLLDSGWGHTYAWWH